MWKRLKLRATCLKRKSFTLESSYEEAVGGRFKWLEQFSWEHQDIEKASQYKTHSTRLQLPLIFIWSMNYNYGLSVSFCSPLTSLDVCLLYARPWSCSAALRSDSTFHIIKHTHKDIFETEFFKKMIQFFKLLLYVTQSYGVRAGSQQCSEAGDICAICQAEFRDPIALLCQVRTLAPVRRCGWGGKLMNEGQVAAKISWAAGFYRPLWLKVEKWAKSLMAAVWAAAKSDVTVHWHTLPNI